MKENVARIIRKIGVHASVGVRHPIDEDVTKGRSIGISVGLSPGLTNGWKYPVALSLYHENLISPNGVHFATLRTLAILGGIGYGWHFGQLSTSVALQAGYAFNSARFDGDLEEAFPAATNVSLDVGNAFMLRPRYHAEYYLTHKFTVRGSLAYIWTKPDIEVTTPTTRYTGVWDASNFNATVGIGFYPFRK